MYPIAKLGKYMYHQLRTRRVLTLFNDVLLIGSFRFLIHDAESSDLGKSALLRMNKEENAALGERRFRVMG